MSENEQAHEGFKELQKACDHPAGARANRIYKHIKGSSDRTSNYIKYNENYDAIQWMCQTCGENPAELIDGTRICEKCAKNE
jgi:hypothetical protein